MGGGKGKGDKGDKGKGKGSGQWQQRDPGRGAGGKGKWGPREKGSRPALNNFRKGLKHQMEKAWLALFTSL